jgi:hypothetical protein
MGASRKLRFTPASNPRPSQTVYEVDSGRMHAAKRDALNKPALKRR